MSVQSKVLPSGWVLKWNPSRPNQMSVDDEKNGSWSDNALRVGGKILYDFPERVPASVKNEVAKFFRAASRGTTSGRSGGVARTPRDTLEAKRFMVIPREGRVNYPVDIHDLTFYLWDGVVQARGSGQDVPRFYAIAFFGKQSKYLWYYAFATEKARDERVAQEIKRVREVEKLKEKKAAERKAPPNRELKVGDILFVSWGYDQTNVEFFEVMAIRKSAIDLQKIGTKILEAGKGSDKVVADRSVRLGMLKSKRIVRGYDGDPRVNIGSSRGSARLWDGKPQYATSWGFGHVGGKTKGQKRVENQYGLTLQEWVAAAGYGWSPKAAASNSRIAAAWRKGEDPSDFRAANERADRLLEKNGRSGGGFDMRRAKNLADWRSMIYADLVSEHGMSAEAAKAIMKKTRHYVDASYVADAGIAPITVSTALANWPKPRGRKAR